MSYNQSNIRRLGVTPIKEKVLLLAGPFLFSEVFDLSTVVIPDQIILDRIQLAAEESNEADVFEDALSIFPRFKKATYTLLEHTREHCA